MNTTPSVRTALLAIGLAVSASCRKSPTDVGDELLRARVDRAAQTLRLTNVSADSLLVGFIGRATAIAALRVPCGTERLGPGESVSRPLPTGESEVIVFHCLIPVVLVNGEAQERSFVVKIGP